MPFPQQERVYRMMAHESDVITAAIESLSVQVSWQGARIHGVPAGEVAGYNDLIHALAEYGGLEEALSAFTVELFAFGNVTVYVDANRAASWPPGWRLVERYANAAGVAGGAVIEAKRAPVANGYGTPALEPGVAPFLQYIGQQAAHMAALQNFVGGAGAMPAPNRANDLAGMNAVLTAIGFGAWNPGGDLPAFGNPAALRASTKAAFEQQMVAPFAQARGLTAGATIAP